jgi:DNA-binding MarR family transcriptional regulator
MRGVLAKRVKKYNITPAQFALLAGLQEIKSASPTDLAQVVDSDVATTFRILDKLEKKGLIYKQDSATDRRSYTVSLTPAGEELLIKVSPQAVDMTNMALRGFQPTEIAFLMSAIPRMIRNFAE